MKRPGLPILLPVILVAVASPAGSAEKPAVPSASLVITDEMLGSRYPPMKLTRRAEDEAYAYTSDHPVVVGGGFAGGKAATYSYLNALAGPDAQKLHYKRIGSCCSFKTANSPFGDTAPLESFEVTYEGLAEPKRLYFNWYDPADPLIPVGLNAVSPDEPDESEAPPGVTKPAQ